MIRTLTKRTTPPGPAEPLAEDHLQLLKRARSEECKAEDAGKEGPEGKGEAAAPTAGMIASIMVADIETIGASLRLRAAPRAPGPGGPRPR